VSVIPGGRVLGDGPEITDARYTLLWDVSRDFFPRRFMHRMYCVRRYLPEAIRLPRAAVLAARGDHAFFHFMFDVLPRIHLLREAEGTFSRPEVLIVNPLRSQFQLRLVEVLEIERIPRVETCEECHLQADELLVPSLEPTYSQPTWAIRYLRDVLLPEAFRASPGNEEAPSRIYVSRRRAPGRRARNQESLERFLRRYGFVPFCLEDLDVLRQIRLFHAADIVVGEHGAGLSHTVFCRQDAVVVELMSPYWIRPTFWDLSSQVGARYGVVFSRAANRVGYSGAVGSYRDFHVDLGELAALFQLLGV